MKKFYSAEMQAGFRRGHKMKFSSAHEAIAYAATDRFHLPQGEAAGQEFITKYGWVCDHSISEITEDEFFGEGGAA